MASIEAIQHPVQRDKELLNPLDLTQGVFYIIGTPVIEEHYGDKKSISLVRVRALSRTYSVEEVSLYAGMH